MDTMCINAERIGLETSTDWRIFRTKLKNAATLRRQQLLHLEEKYYECQLEEFKIAAELEKAERERSPKLRMSFQRPLSKLSF